MPHTVDSPFFHPQFTSIVARACSNVEVAVVEQCNKVVGLLPFQRISKHIGVPVGRPLSDYHGLISASECDVDVADLVRQCGLVGCDLRGWAGGLVERSKARLRCDEMIEVPRECGFL